MSHRTARVHLPAHEPRCEPQYGCSRKGSCARWRAEIPPANASMIGAGLAVHILGGIGDMCPHYLPLVRANEPEKQAVKPAVKGLT